MTTERFYVVWTLAFVLGGALLVGPSLLASTSVDRLTYITQCNDRQGTDRDDCRKSALQRWEQQLPPKLADRLPH
jgi:hypothetical protein